MKMVLKIYGWAWLALIVATIVIIAAKKIFFMIKVVIGLHSIMSFT